MPASALRETRGLWLEGLFVSLASGKRRMLHCNIAPAMNISPSLQLDLEDLLADLHHARRSGDLGRMALLCYCEVRRWARKAGQADLAAVSAAMITGSPHASRQAFLADIDKLVQRLEVLQGAAAAPAPPPVAPTLTPAPAAG
jgi:hypothetical protein